MAVTSKIQPTVRKSSRLVLYNLDQVARFLHVVAYTEVTASNIRIVHHSFMDGGDQIDYPRDQVTIRTQTDNLASALMNHFSMLCKSGLKTAVDGFLQHQKLRYIANRRSIDATFAQFQNSNNALQKNLAIASDITHIVHGAANATFTILSFVVTPGAGLGLAKTLNFTDSMISGPAVIGGVKETLDYTAEKVGDQYSKEAARSLTYIATRTWKYQGALRNAQTRLVTQAGITAGARTLHVFLAVESLQQNLLEIRDATMNLIHSSPVPRRQPVESVPDLQVPSPLH